MFVAYAERHGDDLIKSDRIIEWAIEAPSPEQRRNRLLTVRRFAIAMHAENNDNEAPAADALGRGLFRRTAPYIYSANEVLRLMEAAASLGPLGTIRPLAYVTLFGLLASTGLRISEALALRLADVAEDGLIINRTKFKKSRLVPLHPTARAAIDRYLSVRLTSFPQRGRPVHFQHRSPFLLRHRQRAVSPNVAQNRIARQARASGAAHARSAAYLRGEVSGTVSVQRRRRVAPYSRFEHLSRPRSCCGHLLVSASYARLDGPDRRRR